MFNNPLVMIMAHRSCQQTLDGVLPTWQQLVRRSGVGARLVVASPTDAAVASLGPGKKNLFPLTEYVNAGLQEHFGTIAHARAKEYYNIIESILSRGGNDCVWLAEYDSLVLGNHFPFSDSEEDCMRAYEIAERDPVTGRHYQGFTAEKYYHGPWWFSRKAFFQFNLAFQKLPADCERGLADRTIGLAVQQSGIKVIPSNDIHFTANFIGHESVLSLLLAVNRGVSIVHGFKNESRNNLV
jgi:hypothetical protein